MGNRPVEALRAHSEKHVGEHVACDKEFVFGGRNNAVICAAQLRNMHQRHIAAGTTSISYSNQWNKKYLS